MSFQVAFPSYITVAFTHEVLDLKYRSTELEPVDSNTTPVPRILYRIAEHVFYACFVHDTKYSHGYYGCLQYKVSKSVTVLLDYHLLNVSCDNRIVSLHCRDLPFWGWGLSYSSFVYIVK